MNPEAQTGKPDVIIVMGVSGCGKSTVAFHIAELLHAHYKDGDELHPHANIEKMSSGIALTDEDRLPWLEHIARYAREQALEHGLCVVACSALKKQYRAILNSAGNVVYVYLKGSYDLIATRMQTRSGHFMPSTLLDSQFAALEDPEQEHNVVTVSIEQDAVTIAHNAVDLLRTRYSMS